MPSRNSIKEYASQSYYHIYNRGVEKRTIFHDEQDYSFFINLLRKYLDPGYSPPKGVVYRPSYARSIHLLAYCLMPSHFHLLVYQLDDDKALEKLFRSLMTGYVMYFNKKYRRSGPLFQGRYKASRIDNDSYLSHVSRYIHLNPLDRGTPYETYPYSSFGTYTRSTAQQFIQTKYILDLFRNENYSLFTEDYKALFSSRAKDDNFAYSGLS